MASFIASFSQSILRKLMLVVLSTTFFALLMSGTAMLLYDAHDYKDARVRDLVTQADILGRSSAPALQFNDPATAQGTLGLLRVRPMIAQAAIYGADGRRFANYHAKPGDDGTPALPERAPAAIGYRIDGDWISLTHPIIENGERIGTIYLHSRYGFQERLQNYLLITVAALLASLAVAALIAAWLQRAITGPIRDVSGVARDVMRRRDYSLRAQKRTEDEIGLLVDAFNDMLAQIERRTGAMIEANRSLEREMKERSEAEQALRVADRRKDEFLATLAHELRNPLAPISNGLTLLRLAGDNPALAQNARDIMERQLAQMIRLVDDLIDVSRISTGRLAVKTARIELQAMLKSAVETAAPFIESRGHALALSLPEQPVWLDGDATRLAQVFSNLLNNAAKYTDSGGRIALDAQVIDGQAVISVADNGIGIPPEMLGRVFEMFAQVDKSLERSQAGLGVGLTLARRLVELHGGSIEAHSRVGGADSGSLFVVRLPLAPQPAAESEAAAQGDAQPATPRYRILLADDNIDFANTLATLLRRFGHEVQVAHDGLRALDIAREFAPEFAFLDIGLPGRNGYELARALRELPATARSILVAITGWGQDKDRQQSAEAGFDRHLVKPVQIAQIQDVLQRAGADRATD
jgi:signal transduction histidine kinase/CheY-like chemotaxis protein